MKKQNLLLKGALVFGLIAILVVAALPKDSIGATPSPMKTSQQPKATVSKPIAVSEKVVTEDTPQELKNLKPVEELKPEIAKITVDRSDSIPANLTAGESGWTFTGTMTVDGTTNALIENPTTGDGVFLRVGQTWKNARLISVRDKGLVFTAVDPDLTIRSLSSKGSARKARQSKTGGRK
jgi:hypothetical protein